MVSEFDKLDEQLDLDVVSTRKRLLKLLVFLSIVFFCFFAGVLCAYHYRVSHSPKLIPWLKPSGPAKEKPIIQHDSIDNNMEIYNRLQKENDLNLKKIEQILPKPENTPLDPHKAKTTRNNVKSKDLMQKDLLSNTKKFLEVSTTGKQSQSNQVLSTAIDKKVNNMQAIRHVNTSSSNSFGPSKKSHVKFEKKIINNRVVWEAQIGVTHNQKEAITLFKEWKKLYPELFNHKHLVFEEIHRSFDLMYRMRVVPFSEYRHVAYFCAHVKNKHIPCLPVKIKK